MCLLLNRFSDYAPSDTWSFPGLELLLFLLAFSVTWDAFTLHEQDWKHTFGVLRDVYNVNTVQSVTAYVVPVLLAVLVVGAQLSSGTGADSIRNILNTAKALAGKS